MVRTQTGVLEADHAARLQPWEAPKAWKCVLDPVLTPCVLSGRPTWLHRVRLLLISPLPRLHSCAQTLSVWAAFSWNSRVQPSAFSTPRA